MDSDEVSSPAGPTAPPPVGVVAPGVGAPGVGEAPRPLSAAAPPARRRRRWLPWLLIIVLSLAIAVVLRLFIVQTFFVPSGSMIPTLLPGDRILVQKIAFSVGEGSIIVFRTPPGYRPSECSGTAESDLVKRVIGLPGEHISSSGNTVLVNGKALPEPYLPKGTILGSPIPPQVVPPGNYFVMGDNRDISCDSRVWGDVPSSDVVGTVFLVIWRNGHPAFHTI
jgi:signal peptidase I